MKIAANFFAFSHHPTSHMELVLTLTTPLRAPCLEADVLKRARSGERRALETLLGEFRERIFNLAWQMLRERSAAEDATQEIFVRAFEKLPSFREQSEFGTWLYRLALNHCLERQRVAARRENLAPVEEWSEDNQKGGHEFSRRVETRLALENALAQLPETLRITLVLREWHGFSYDEIARILRVPSGTVRSRLNEARKRFIAIWEAEHEQL